MKIVVCVSRCIGWGRVQCNFRVLRLGAAHIGVAHALASERALWPMAGNEHGVIAHGPQTLRDAVDQIVVVALRKVGAANAARKQHIAHKRTLDLG